MEQHERIKKVRKAFNLTMEQFGERIGVAKSTISNIEKGNRNATDHMIKSICREYNVNEDWLRTGSGGDENMFIPEDAIKYIKMGKAAKTPNEFREFLIQIMESLPDEYCDFLYEEFKRFAENQAKKKGNS